MPKSRSTVTVPPRRRTDSESDSESEESGLLQSAPIDKMFPNFRSGGLCSRILHKQGHRAYYLYTPVARGTTALPRPKGSAGRTLSYDKIDLVFLGTLHCSWAV